MNIYLAGGISDLTESEYNGWRLQLQDMLSVYNVHICNPVAHFSVNDVMAGKATEREAMEFDLHKVRHSDLIICNFNNIYSLGTMSELAIAYEHKIPILGLKTVDTVLHPWQECMCNHIFTDIEELFLYVGDHYIEDR